MIEIHRKSKARAAAHEYAPKPEGSSIIYGVIGDALVGVGLLAFNIFYATDVFTHPVFVALVLAMAFTGGVVLRKRRTTRHADAYEAEYLQHDNKPPTNP